MFKLLWLSCADPTLAPGRGFALNAPAKLQTPDAPRTDDRLIWLLGQPQLAEYLSFVKERVIGGDVISPRILADEWRAANDVYYELEQAEADDADRMETRPLPGTLEPLAATLRAHPHYESTFDSLPTTVEMVELDRLVVWQSHVGDSFAKAHGASLGPDPDPADLFRFCFPLDRELPLVRIEQMSDDRYRFVSPATDLRALEAVLLGPAQLATLHSYGPVTAAIGLMVGFSANFLSGIRSDNRILLHNGYHRAYALRAQGITHAPCILQTVSRKDELTLIADGRVSSDPEFYFRAKRPPMLRDFFDPRLAKPLHIRPIDTVVEIEFKMRDMTSAALSE